MDTIVRAIWRAFAGRRNASVAPTGARILPAYAALARYHAHTTDLEPRLRLLVTQLAAERSRCRWCIERGRHEWREAHLALDQLCALLRYETSPLFSPRDKAALRFADAVTRYRDDMSVEPLSRARQHLSEPEIVAVTAAVAAEHFFNPITGALGADVSAWGAPIGSSIRSLWL